MQYTPFPKLFTCMLLERDLMIPTCSSFCGNTRNTFCLKGEKRLNLKQVSQLRGFCLCSRNCANIKLDVCSYPSQVRSCRSAETAAAPMRNKSAHIFSKEKTQVFTSVLLLQSVLSCFLSIIHWNNPLINRWIIPLALFYLNTTYNVCFTAHL